MALLGSKRYISLTYNETFYSYFPGALYQGLALYWDSYCQVWSLLKIITSKILDKKAISNFQVWKKNTANSIQVEPNTTHIMFYKQCSYWITSGQFFMVFAKWKFWNVRYEDFPFCHHRFHVWLAWKKSETLQDFSLQVLHNICPINPSLSKFAK